MIRTASFIAIAACALAACQPQKTPEQIQQEQAAAAIQQMAAALGATANGQNVPQLDSQQMAAAMAMAGAMAANDPSVSAEDRAKMQAISGAMASGQAHPAANAWLTGANKTFAILGKVTDVASANAAKVQLAPIYAEMAGPAATLKAMTDDQRDVAFGSAMSQVMAMSMNAMTLMMPLASKPEVAELVEDMLDEMPNPG
jgi:hypothetical protein